MIRYVKIKNYKSLINLDVNFMKTKTIPKKFALIYGENGIGKTNFVNSFYTLNETMRTMSASEMFKKTILDLGKNYLEYENKELVNRIERQIRTNYKDIKTIIEDCKTIDSEDNMILEIGFKHDNKNGLYHIEMDNSEIVSEYLEFVLNKNVTTFFKLEKCGKIYLNSNVFLDDEYYKEFQDLVDKYWGLHSIFSIFSYEIDDKKKGYLDNKISKSLFEAYFALMSICTKVKQNGRFEFGVVGTQHKLIRDFMDGEISINKELDLDTNEYILNSIFTGLYSDIKKVFYKKNIEGNKIVYRLFCLKNIYGKMLEVEFSRESNGTRKILELIPYLISACEGQTVIIDELDTGIHDLLVKNIIEGIYPYIKGQLIITTHNTMLFDSLIPHRDIYVFNVNSSAVKKLVAITDFDNTIQKNHSPRKQYLNGIYGGIPISSSIDYDEIIDTLQ